MNSKERILTTFNHEEPDRVPIFELSIESLDVIRGYTGGNKIISLYDLDVEYATDLYKKIGIDLYSVPVIGLPIGKGGVGKKISGLKTSTRLNMIDEFGRVFYFYKSKESGLELTNYIGGMFFSETGNLEEIIAKYEKWGPLDAKINLRFIPYERAIKNAKNEGPYVIPGIQGLFENSWEPFGFENYTKLLFEYPDFINEVLKSNLEFLKELIEMLIDRYSIELIMYWDDHGHKTGPFLSPEKFRKLIYPRMKDFIGICHKNNVKVIHHSCGNINRVLDDIINTGIDGLNPLEPAAAMDIFEVKKKVGDKIILIGNVDTIDLLAKGTERQIRDYVKKEIKYCTPNLIMASGHSINPAISFKNYSTLIDTTFKYGNYPILIKD